MARIFVVNGECLVSVQGMVGTDIEEASELGLAERGITVTPRYSHKDIHVDDFGPDIPIDVLTQLAECTITMTLVDFDPDILDACLAESMGGGIAGTMEGSGILLGAGIPLYEDGCHYITVTLASPVLGNPWTFPASYMPVHPAEIPLGTSKTLAKLMWRAIPYVVPNGNNELVSRGAVVWLRGTEHSIHT